MHDRGTKDKQIVNEEDKTKDSNVTDKDEKPGTEQEKPANAGRQPADASPQPASSSPRPATPQSGQPNRPPQQVPTSRATGRHTGHRHRGRLAASPTITSRAHERATARQQAAIQAVYTARRSAATGR